jgi:hypothetical protein
MTKSNAKKGIDFNRLFSVKDKLGVEGAADRAPLADSTFPLQKGRGDAGPEQARPPTAEPSRPPEVGTVIAFPTEHVTHDAGAPTDTVMTAIRPPAPASPSTTPREEASDAIGRLRVGLPRSLHERLRASAALACVPSTAFVRDMLESAAPRFAGNVSLSELSQVARTAFPEASLGRRPIEIRMQVPVTEDLHRRLLQLAALRAQTLGGCMVDLLEHRLPR